MQTYNGLPVVNGVVDYKIEKVAVVSRPSRAKLWSVEIVETETGYRPDMSGATWPVNNVRRETFTVVKSQAEAERIAGELVGRGRAGKWEFGYVYGK